MPFKMTWEKASARQSLPQGLVERMIQQAYPAKELVSYTLLAGGCANLNIKFQLVGDAHPLMLRVYLRDPDARHKEQKLGELLSCELPVPTTLYAGELDGYCFAVTQFMPGIPLRDLLLGDQPYDLHSVMYNVGKALGAISDHTFPCAGSFDKDLNVIASLDDMYDFADQCLQDRTVVQVLPAELRSRISYFLNKYWHLLPDPDERRLVHADFDPANIFVDCVQGTWKVSAILDWEFAFAGSPLCDVANMLRYAHYMPAAFTDSFLEGLSSTGRKLPKDWCITTHLLNISSLLDCLKRADPQGQSNQCADILSLVEHMIGELDGAGTNEIF